MGDRGQPKAGHRNHPCFKLPTNQPTNQPTRFTSVVPQVATFLEANGRGYWEAQPEQLERLRQMYM